MCEISVIMSVYNQEKFLSESIESILCQSERNFEFLIIDDGSSDSSYDLIQNYSKIDDRIKLFKNSKNLGLTKSLNKILKKAKGKYIARMDADDISIDSRLKEELSVFTENKNIGVVFSLCQIIDSDGNLICNKWQPKNINNILDKMPYHNYITHSSCMINRNLFKKFGGYNENYNLAQDWELWLRLIKQSVNFYCVNKVLLLFRAHDSNISNKLSKSLIGSSRNFAIAILKIRNHNKLDAVLFVLHNRISFSEFMKFMFNLLMPQVIFTFASVLHKKHYKNSTIKKLHNQK